MPTSVPRPPVIAVPPTTTAAIAFNSRPMPALPGTTENRTAFSSAAIPTRPPVRAKTQEDHSLRVDPGEARGLGFRADCVDFSSGDEISHHQAAATKIARVSRLSTIRPVPWPRPNH